MNTTPDDDLPTTLPGQFFNENASLGHIHVVILGAGFAGLGMAIRIKQRGYNDFIVIERASDIGGTWRDNTYPGCACDIPSHLYSFSFVLNPHWSRAFSPQRAESSAQAWYLKRSYNSFEEMAETEAGLPDGIDFVMVAVPNHMHYPVARAFLEHGIHVVCDKPMTFNLEEARALVELVDQKELIFALTHNYTGYPMVRHARHLVRTGAIGTIRKVLVEYLQDWLMEPVEHAGNKQALWRTDPTKSGIAGSIGDIGTHGENLMEFITGLKIAAVCADLTSFIEGRRLDDDANMLLRMENGAKGILTCSQIAAGEENALSIRVYGSKAGLEWHQMEPNTLLFKQPGQPQQILRTGMPYMSDEAKASTRLPAGHPEGFLEAFANVYRLAIADIRRVESGESPVGGYPTVYDGLRGMQFITKVVESSQKGGMWVEF